MAAKFESSGLAGFAAANNNNAVVLTLPATRPVGSVLLIFAFAKLITATVTTAPAGYTLLGTWTSGTAGGGRCWLYAKEVVGGETAPSIAITGATGTTGEEWGAGMACYSDVDLAGGIANILDGTAAVTDASGTTTCTYAANTITQADSMLVRFLARWEDLNVTFTASATWNQRHGVSTTNRTGANFQTQDKVASASGSQASTTVTPSSSVNTRYLAVSFALKSAPPPVPLVEDLLDNFDRADGPVYAGAGASLWDQNRIDWSTDTLARIYSNRLGNPGATYEQAVSKPTLGPGDFDLIVECAVTGAAPNEMAIWFCLAGTGLDSANLRGYAFIGSSASSYWAVRRYSAGVNQGVIAGPASLPPIVAGDTVWFAKRGTTFTIYRKPSGGSYSKILSFTDANFSEGKIAMEMSDATIRWDNIRGGPWTGLGPTTQYGVVAQAITFGKDVIAQPQTRYGVVALPITFTKAVSGVRKAFGVVALPMIFSKAVVGQRKTFGVVALPVTFTKAVSGVKKTFGISAMPITFGKDVKAVSKKFGVVAAPFTFSSTTQGKLTALGKVVMTITFGKDVLWGTPTIKVLNKLNTFNMGVTPVKRIYAGIKQVWP
jgi:hypothetical protein